MPSTVSCQSKSRAFSVNALRLLGLYIIILTNVTELTVGTDTKCNIFFEITNNKSFYLTWLTQTN